MTVKELEAELKARNITPTGLKTQLVSLLNSARETNPSYRTKETN
jgi:hypothetical protein